MLLYRHQFSSSCFDTAPLTRQLSCTVLLFQWIGVTMKWNLLLVIKSAVLHKSLHVKNGNFSLLVFCALGPAEELTQSSLLAGTMLELLFLLSFLGHESYITFCHLENEAAFTCSADHTIRKWDVVTGQCLAIYRGHTSIVNRLVPWSSSIVFL